MNETTKKKKEMLIPIERRRRTLILKVIFCFLDIYSIEKKKQNKKHLVEITFSNVNIEHL
jgi:hypothetical protein